MKQYKVYNVIQNSIVCINRKLTQYKSSIPKYSGLNVLCMLLNVNLPTAPTMAFRNVQANHIYQILSFLHSQYIYHSWCGFHLEALAVHNRWAGLVVFLLADPHLLEGGQGGEDGAADPYRVLAFWSCDDVDLHCLRSESSDLFLHAVSDARGHRAATRQHSVVVKVFTDVYVALHDTVVCYLVDTARLHTQEARLKHSLWASEPLVAYGDHLAVGKLVTLLQGRRSGRCCHILLEVKCNVAQLLLDVANDFSLGRRRETVAALGEDLHQVVGEITASQVKTHDGVGQGVTLVDRHDGSDTISRVEQ